MISLRKLYHIVCLYWRHSLFEVLKLYILWKVISMRFIQFLKYIYIEYFFEIQYIEYLQKYEIRKIWHRNGISFDFTKFFLRKFLNLLDMKKNLLYTRRVQVQEWSCQTSDKTEILRTGWRYKNLDKTVSRKIRIMCTLILDDNNCKKYKKIVEKKFFEWQTLFSLHFIKWIYSFFRISMSNISKFFHRSGHFLYIETNL